MFSVKIIEDSHAGYEKDRLTTFQLSYPRFCHAEFLTHRVFSRNASSSRAIPIHKMIESVKNSPAMPVHWGQNQSGMQADNEITDTSKAVELWLEAAASACHHAEKLNTLGLHKQVVNRILEPFQYIHVVVTASDYSNFFKLRSHKDAQPEIKLLSDMMMESYNKNKPKDISNGGLHLPYILEEEFGLYSVEELLKMSTARCARVSYLTHDNKKPSYDNDMKLFHRLITSEPMHASPTEHQARTWFDHEHELSLAVRKGFSGNFNNSKFFQYRKYLEHEKNYEYYKNFTFVDFMDR
jgi:thymidylate synthase ThyX